MKSINHSPGRQGLLFLKKIKKMIENFKLNYYSSRIVIAAFSVVVSGCNPSEIAVTGLHIPYSFTT